MIYSWECPKETFGHSLFFSPLRLMNKQVGWVAVCLIVVSSCAQSSRTEQPELARLEEKLSALKPNQALVKVLVGNQDFYADQPLFTANVQILPQLIQVGFTNEQGSNVELEMIQDNWFGQKPIAFTMTNGTLGETQRDQVILMIGKLIDKRALRGEGYYLVTGKITVPVLSNQLMSIVFVGNVVKPSQASTVDNYIPVKGWIMVKQPAFSSQSSPELLTKIGTAPSGE